MIVLFEDNIKGDITIIWRDRYVNSDDNKKILYLDANNLYGYALVQILADEVLKFVLIQDPLITEEYSDFGYNLDFDLKFPDEI